MAYLDLPGLQYFAGLLPSHFLSTGGGTLTGPLIIDSATKNTAPSLVVGTPGGMRTEFNGLNRLNYWINSTTAGSLILQQNGGSVTFGGDIAPMLAGAGNVGSISQKFLAMYATNFYGNASTASAFNVEKAVTLTGAVTGTASSTGGWSVVTALNDEVITEAKIADGQLSYKKLTADLKAMVDAGNTALASAKTYADTVVSSAYRVKGSCTYANLPTTGQKTGDVWNVTDKNGMNYVWTGSAWDALGGIIDLPTASASTAGVTKLYTSTGTASDGTMTQSLITMMINAKADNTAMGGATSSAAGTAGLVPAPAAGKQAYFLRGDGTWVVPTNTTYDVATTSANGLMSAADKTKLNGITAITTAEIDAIFAS